MRSRTRQAAAVARAGSGPARPGSRAPRLVNRRASDRSSGIIRHMRVGSGNDRMALVVEDAPHPLLFYRGQYARTQV